jgi:phosphatidylserine/phosphatidylglycerophosphate/cardiolipin synthase-like enzyme
MRLTAAVIATSFFATSAFAAEPVPANVSVCFTPAEHCEPRIVAAIDAAQSSIRVQAYGFTSFPIIHALQRAAVRGVEVMAILDKTNEKKYSGATLLEAAGIPVWIDYEPAIAHNKIMVVDGHLTIGGSFNFTMAAERRNAENVTFMESPELAAEYLANWNGRLRVSREFEEKASAGQPSAE